MKKCVDLLFSYTDNLLIGFQIPEVQKPTCKDPLGMENGSIPNSAITASSQLGSTWTASHSRLNYKGTYGAWIPEVNDRSQWLQVNFGRETQVTGIGTQGYYHAVHYVESYTLQYSNDGSSFQKYQQQSHTKVKVLVHL